MRDEFMPTMPGLPEQVSLKGNKNKTIAFRVTGEQFIWWQRMKAEGYNMSKIGQFALSLTIAEYAKQGIPSGPIKRTGIIV